MKHFLYYNCFSCFLIHLDIVFHIDTCTLVFILHFLMMSTFNSFSQTFSCIFWQTVSLLEWMKVFWLRFSCRNLAISSRITLFCTFHPTALASTKPSLWREARQAWALASWEGSAARTEICPSTSKPSSTRWDNLLPGSCGVFRSLASAPRSVISNYQRQIKMNQLSNVVFLGKSNDHA